MDVHEIYKHRSWDPTGYEKFSFQLLQLSINDVIHKLTNFCIVTFNAFYGVHIIDFYLSYDKIKHLYENRVLHSRLSWRKLKFWSIKTTKCISNPRCNLETMAGPKNFSVNSINVLWALRFFLQQHQHLAVQYLSQECMLAC